MVGSPKLTGHILVLSSFATQIQLAYASGESPYESGYDHGCDDADISDPDIDTSTNPKWDQVSTLMNLCVDIMPAMMNVQEGVMAVATANPRGIVK